MYPEILSLYQSKQYQKAEQYARKHLVSNSQDVPVWNILAACLNAQGRLQEALDLKAEIIQKFPDDPSARNNYGNALKQIGRLDEAEEILRETIKRWPEFPQAQLNLGNVLLEQGRVKQAQQHYEKALKLDPYYVNAHFHLGLALRDQDKLSQSYHQFKTAFLLDSNNFRYLLTASAVLLHEPALLSTELPWIEKQAQKFSNAELMRNIGICLLRTNHPRKAITYLLNSSSPISLGNAYKALGETDKALQSYQKALDDDSDNLDAAGHICFLTQFLNVTPQDRYKAAARYGDILKRRVKPLPPPRLKPPPPIVVGFVSRDWYSHPVAYFLLGLLENLDRDKVRVIGFQAQPNTDA